MSSQPDRQASLSPAEIYEREGVPAIFAAWVGALLDLVEPRSEERLLDVACGTGVVARRALGLVGAGGHVAGVDVNTNMLDVARAIAPAVEWHEGNAMALPFADRAFDVVVCQQGLQFFPDPGIALGQMRRVLDRRGRLGLAVWSALDSSPGHDVLVRSVERHVGANAATVVATPFRLSDEKALRSLVEAAGFHDVRVRQEQRAARFPSAEAFTRMVLGGGTLARAGIEVSDGALAAIIGEVDRAMEPYVQANGMVFPMESRLLLAQV